MQLTRQGFSNGRKTNRTSLFSPSFSIRIAGELHLFRTEWRMTKFKNSRYDRFSNFKSLWRDTAPMTIWTAYLQRWIVLGSSRTTKSWNADEFQFFVWNLNRIRKPDQSKKCLLLLIICSYLDDRNGSNYIEASTSYRSKLRKWENTLTISHNKFLMPSPVEISPSEVYRFVIEISSASQMLSPSRTMNQNLVQWEIEPQW
jgi:hypothetical protein